MVLSCWMALGEVSAQTADLIAEPDGRCRQWVDSVMARLTPAEKVGQLLVATFPARADKATKRAVKETVKRLQVGGLLFSEGSPEEQAMLTNEAQRQAKVPLMVTFDGEWGLSMRLTDVPDFPKNAALGCITDNSLIEAYGREVAREFRELGVQVNFAPVADVSTNPSNPVIHVRSFGENAAQVADKVEAYVRGLQQGGVMAVGKHFPGHGDTDVDSHKGLPVVRHSRQRLDSVELLPFRRLVEAGCGGMMVGHLQVPALEADSMLPASLSGRVIDGLLKQEMGFRGLVFSDALDMRGVSFAERLYVKALKAGNDLLLVQSAADKAVKEVMKALADGELTEAEVEAKCRRVLAAKYLLGLRGRQPERVVSGMSFRISTPEAQELADRLHRESVTVLGNRFGVLPLTLPPAGSPAAQDKEAPAAFALLSLGDKGADSVFVAELKRLSQVAVDCYYLPKQASEAEQAELARKLSAYHRVIISVSGRESDMLAYAEFLLGLELPAPVVYTFFAPYRCAQLLDRALWKAGAVVLGHSGAAVVQKHVAAVLLAKADAHGRLAMSIGRYYPVGAGTDIVAGQAPGRLVPEDYGMRSYELEGIDRLALAGRKAGAYPGCRILVLKDGITVYDAGFGTHTYTDTLAVKPDDLFDLGALTNTSATLLAVMKLYDSGRLKLDDKVSKYVPVLRSGSKRNITVRELLLHESGLTSHVRVYLDAIDPNSVHGPYSQSWVDQWHKTKISEHSYFCTDFSYKKGLVSSRKTGTHTLQMADGLWMNRSFKQTILQRIAHTDPEGRRYVYSDLGFLLLQQVVEAVTGMPLDRYVDREFYQPMGLKHTLFRPLERFRKLDIMPTVCNDYFRRQDLCGYVYDEMAAAMGGVAGNAGLFSTAADLARIYQMLLNGGVLDGRRYLSAETCRLFTTTTSTFSRRGLGFDRPDTAIVKRSPCAPSAPASVYGHTGFTGTCVWVDPDNKLVYVFLSNKLCPNVWNTKLGDMNLRRDIQEHIYRSLFDNGVNQW